LFDLSALATYGELGPGVRILADDGTARLMLFAFRAGQRLKEHRTSSPIVVQVVSGAIMFSMGGREAEMRAGMALRLRGDVEHGISAQTDALVLVIMTPSPRAHTLETDAFSHREPPAGAQRPEGETG
jgi:quercetin dioxygenase-like cupin family protein